MIVPAHNHDARLTLVSWLAGKLGTDGERLIGQLPFEIVAVLRNGGNLMGAVLYNNYRYPVIEMSCAGEPGWLTRADLRDLFAYPFRQLGCWTVLTGVRRGNAIGRTFNKKLGFRELCAVPQGPHRSHDTILYCMTRDQCRWLPPERLH